MGHLRYTFVTNSNLREVSFEKLKSQESAGKAMLRCLGNATDMFYVFLEYHRVINTVYYFSMLANNVKYWNALVYRENVLVSFTAMLTLHVWRLKMGWETLDTLFPYSPDLSSSDFFLFDLAKEALHCVKFQSNEEVLKNALNWLQHQDTELFAANKKKFVRSRTSV